MKGSTSLCNTTMSNYNFYHAKGVLIVNGWHTAWMDVADQKTLGLLVKLVMVDDKYRIGFKQTGHDGTN